MLTRLVLLLPLLTSICGCAPKEMFSSLDRNCYLPDWTNHHSCMSCCCKNGSCSHPAPATLPMLELGGSSAVAAASN